jgi:hypothetical protein
LLAVAPRTKVRASGLRLLHWAWLCTALHAGPLFAQQTVSITGRVLDAGTSEPVPGVHVQLEGAASGVLTDSLGRYLILRAAPGPQVIRAERIGYATARVSVTVPPEGVLTHDIRLATSALQVPGIIVTADPVGRARGELGTASVIEREAIRHQTATSLAGLLELVPGVPVSPPGLGGVQQISLRSAPVAGLGLEIGPSGSNFASAGTLIVLDGVPLSNNANLQTLGPRGEVPVNTAAGGGVDLRRLPAALIDRVEAIRGIPSARFGDLTQGAIVVDTRAGAVDSELMGRVDRHTVETSFLAGRTLGQAHTGTVMLNLARTTLSPGILDDEAYRVSTQLSHRLASPDSRLTLDTRIEYFDVFQKAPEQPNNPGRALRARDMGLRVAERARFQTDRGPLLEATLALDVQQQRLQMQTLRSRGALPFTDRLTDGRATGWYVGGPYISDFALDGDPRLLFGRFEASHSASWAGLDHELRSGIEWRREWNGGRGYQFDMERPPQVTFNGVQGFDRPRTFADIPAVAASALYIDDRVSRTLPGNVHLQVQAGARMDVLHDGGHWLTGARHLVPQPRLSVQLAPQPWLRLRGGAGRTTKYPSVEQLHPSLQYHDVINVNWYANDPAERLAVLTTTVLNPSNPALRQAVADKAEAGFEIGFGRGGGVLSVVAFLDRINDGIGRVRTPTFLLREHFQLADSMLGTGRPPRIIEPAFRADTVPVLLVQPANNVMLDSRGYELTLATPELPRIGTRIEVQGAWIRSRMESEGIEVGTYFNDFQLGTAARTPYWEGTARTGSRTLLNYRLIHQQPAAGLAVTLTIQHTIHEERRTEAGVDTLAFAGYVTRTGDIVPVPEAQRGEAQYQDLRWPRIGVSTAPITSPADWLASLQVSKTLPLDGRLAFYAFNAFSREGRFGAQGQQSRVYPPMRFGLDLSFAPGALLR